MTRKKKPAKKYPKTPERIVGPADSPPSGAELLTQLGISQAKCSKCGHAAANHDGEGCCTVTACHCRGLEATLSAREDLGYVPGVKHLTPEREKALFDTEAELSVAQSDLASAQLDMASAIEGARAAKKKVSGKDALVEALLHRLADIVGNRPYKDELEGMGPGEGPAPASDEPAEEV